MEIGCHWSYSTSVFRPGRVRPVASRKCSQPGSDEQSVPQERRGRETETEGTDGGTEHALKIGCHDVDRRTRPLSVRPFASRSTSSKRCTATSRFGARVTRCSRARRAAATLGSMSSARSCCNLGERPAGVGRAGLFALHCAAARGSSCAVSPQGVDDHGRPGALAFHGLFITPRDYRRAGADPFAFLPWLDDDWNDAAVELHHRTVDGHAHTC